MARVVPIDEELALLAAKCYFELLEKSKKDETTTPGLADGIILAAGRKLKAKVLTGDRHFKGLKEVIWIGSD